MIFLQNSRKYLLIHSFIEPDFGTIFELKNVSKQNEKGGGRVENYVIVYFFCSIPSNINGHNYTHSMNHSIIAIVIGSWGLLNRVLEL